MSGNIKHGINLMMEIDKLFKIDDEYWLPIKDFVNYSVSTYGNVRNNKTGRILKVGKVGKVGKDYYAVKLSENGKVKTMKIHTLVSKAFISNPKNKRCVDHIDHNRFNNYILNLRFATDSENCMNRSKLKNNSSGFIGVSSRKDIKKYRAQYALNGKLKHIGYYETPEEASFAYQEKIKEHYKEYANL